MTERVVSSVPDDGDAQFEAGLRPRRLDDYIGQERVRALCKAGTEHYGFDPRAVAAIGSGEG